jgi:adenylate cyclase
VEDPNTPIFQYITVMTKVMWKVIAVVVMACAAGIISVMVGRIPVVATLEHRTVDWRMRYQEADPAYGKNIVIVLIDDVALQGFPYRSPVPRDMLANLIRIVHASGAKLIGIDVFLKDLSWDEHDAELVNAMRKSGRVVIVSAFRKEGGKNKGYSVDFPHPKFLEAALATSLVELPVDPVDGVARHYQTFFQIEDKTLPTLATTLYLLDHGVEVPEHKFLTRQSFEDVWPTGIDLDSSGRFYINYQSPPFKIGSEYNPLKVFPASAVLTGLLPSEWFENTIVLIGAGFTDSKDDLPTPYYSRAFDYVLTPGVEIHANALATLQYGKTVAFLSTTTTWLLLSVCSLPIIACTLRFRSIIALGLMLAGVMSFSVFGFWVFVNSSIALALVPFGIGLGIAYIEAIAYKAATEGRQKRWIKHAFQMYVSSDVVNLLVRDPDKLHLGGEAREISILFSDLADFTSISEFMTPEYLVALLTSYFDGMTEIILKHGGTLDKYIGDAIMAFWNAPLYQPDHAQRAARAALEMQAFSEQFSKRLTTKGNSAITTRIGLNTGKVVVGNIGSHKHFNYTIMGDEVNLASRLEGANKTFGTTLMISESTFEWIHQDFRTRELDLLRVKGRTTPVRVYELLGARDHQFSEAFEQMLHSYEQGLAAYRQRDWSMAITSFETAVEHVPTDHPSRIYLERSQQMQTHPPDEDWDGVYIMHTK